MKQMWTAVHKYVVALVTGLTTTHRKTTIALAGVAVLVAQQELGAGSKWYGYLVAVLTAVGVYGTPNA